MKDIYITSEIDEELADEIIKRIHAINNETKAIIDMTVEDIMNSYEDMDREEAELELALMIDSAVQPIKIHIFSPGGEVHSAFAIIGAMRQSELPIETYAYGLVASSAFIIFLNGSNRHVSNLARLMYHDISYGLDHATSRQNEYQMEESKVLQKMFHDITIENSSIPEEMLNESVYRIKDLYFNAEEAIRYKMAEHTF